VDEVRKLNGLRKLKLENLMIILFSVIMFLSLFIFQLMNINPFASTWDQVDFALAISRYDLLAMQPHFPGYPYFILGGKIFSILFDNPAKSLAFFNICLFSTTLYPTYQIGKRYLTKEKALLFSVILYSSSYVLLLVNQPISEGAAISVLCWYVWSLQKSLHSQNSLQILIPLLFLSILFGIRLSYLPFAIGIVYLFYIKWKMKQVRIKRLLQLTFVGMMFQMIWVLAIALSEGSITGFIKLSIAFTSGHFQDWGGSVGSNSIPLWDRIYQFIIHNIFWTGFFTQSKILMFMFGFMFLLLIFYLYKNRFSLDKFYVLILFLNATYFIWALLAQNIDKPRHIIPIVMLSLVFTFILYLQKSNKFGISFISIFLIAQWFQATTLIKEQATQIPATYQLEKFLEEKNEPFIVYTWEETRVLEYLHATFPHKRIHTYDIFKHDSSYYYGHEILLTDKVISGFENQGINISNQVEKVGEFQSNSLFDPVYDRIILYKWGVVRNE
jgi:hypothetical protein